MATFKFGDVSALTLSEKITIPSIHLQKDNEHLYVPLFNGNKGYVIEFNGYNYTLGGLKVGDYRAAISREIALYDPDTGAFSQRNSVFKVTAGYGSLVKTMSECLHESSRNENSWNSKSVLFTSMEYGEYYGGNKYSAVEIVCTPLNMDNSFKFKWYDFSGSSNYNKYLNHIVVYKSYSDVFSVSLDITGSSGKVETWHITCL